MFLEVRTIVVTSTWDSVFSRNQTFFLMFVGWGAHVSSGMWRSEDNFFHHVGPGNRVQIAVSALAR